MLTVQKKKNSLLGRDKYLLQTAALAKYLPHINSHLGLQGRDME